MNFDLVEYLKSAPVIALVGATTHSGKFGNIILRDMLFKGYRVIPINPRATKIEGIEVYPTISAAASEIEIGLVNYVVPPAITNETLKEAKNLGLMKAWVQPGAGNQETRDYLEKENFDYLFNACIMVQSVSTTQK